MSANRQIRNSKPTAILGAGELVSHLFAHEDTRKSYQFNLFRMERMTGEPRSWFEPADLRDLVKICQVLAFTIVDDGWAAPEIPRELRRLFVELDELTQDWSDP